MAVPWKALEAAGVKKEQLKINFRTKGRLAKAPESVNTSFRILSHSVSFDEQKTSPRPHTVRLHFAEPDNVRPGQRVFDVRLQGKAVLENLDVIQAAGGRNVALIKEFKGVLADRTLELELIPKAKAITPATATIVSGIEIVAEGER